MVIPDLNDNPQFKYNQIYPSEAQIYYATRHIHNIWPELKQYENSTCVISASLGNPCRFNERLPKNVAEEIRFEYNKGKRNFIFQCLDEGLSIGVLDVLHGTLNFIEDLLPFISVIYATGAFDGDLMYHKYCVRNNIPVRLNVICGSNFENNCKGFLDHVIDYVPGKKEKKFLCFNKEARQHRITLFEKLLELDLVKDAFYSFVLKDDILNSILTMENQCYQNILGNLNKLPLVLNRTIERDNPVDIRKDDLKYFNNSYFSVIPETLYYGMDKNSGQHYIYISEIFGNFPSEKIYKALALKHPFILVTTPGFLKNMRSRGYKTFSPFIDESYDDIEDDNERLNRIVQEIYRMCNLTEEQLIEFTYNVQSIVEHNHSHYMSNTDFAITKNVISLLK